MLLASISSSIQKLIDNDHKSLKYKVDRVFVHSMGKLVCLYSNLRLSLYTFQLQRPLEFRASAKILNVHLVVTRSRVSHKRIVFYYFMR